MTEKEFMEFMRQYDEIDRRVVQIVKFLNANDTMIDFQVKGDVIEITTVMKPLIITVPTSWLWNDKWNTTDWHVRDVH